MSLPESGEWRTGLYQIINNNSRESAGEWRRGLYQIINSNDRCLLLAVSPQCVFVCKSLSRYSRFIFMCMLFDSLTTEHDDVELPVLQLDVSIRHRGLIAPFLFHFDEHRQALFLDAVDDLGRWCVPYPCSSLPRKWKTLCSLQGRGQNSVIKMKVLGETKQENLHCQNFGCGNHWISINLLLVLLFFPSSR